MTNGQSFKDLVVWEKSVLLAKMTYTSTAKLPKAEQFGLVSQMNRAVISIASNIAEGSKRGTQKEFVQFLRIASGSAAELETQFIIAQDIFPQVDFHEQMYLLHEVQKILTTLIRKMK